MSEHNQSRKIEQSVQAFEQSYSAMVEWMQGYKNDREVFRTH